MIFLQTYSGHPEGDSMKHCVMSVYVSVKKGVKVTLTIQRSHFVCVLMNNSQQLIDKEVTL